MFGLSKKRSRFIGMDFGTSSIKAIELSNKGNRPFIENYGIFDLRGVLQGEISDSKKPKTYDTNIKEAVKLLVDKLDLEDGSVCVAMPGFSGLVVLIEFPDMEEDEIEKAIRFEAHKHIPTSLDEVSISWEVVGRKNVKIEKESKITSVKIQVILVAAPKKEVVKYGELVKSVGLEMDAVELETFSIARSLVGHDKGTHIIIDIGHIATNIILVDKGFVLINRNINVGGNDITSSIADSMGISKARAEVIKKEDRDMLNTKQSSIVIPVLDLISGETQRIVSTFNEKMGGEDKAKVDGVILSGGSANMVGIDKYFADNLKLAVTKGNPWKKVGYNDKLKDAVQSMGASFSAAIGAALRSIEDNTK